MSERYQLNSKNREVLAVIGKHLQYSRERKRYSISKLAKLANVSRATLYATERGDVTYYLIIWVYVMFCDADLDYINKTIAESIVF